MVPIWARGLRARKMEGACPRFVIHYRAGLFVLLNAWPYCEDRGPCRDDAASAIAQKPFAQDHSV